MTSRTFLLTDIEASSAMWERYPEEMAAALTRHDAIVADGVGSYGGVVHKTRGEGDSAFCTFESAAWGVRAAYEIQRTICSESPAGMELKLRMGIHAGEALEREGDFFGPTVNRAARLRGIAHGGQVLVSEAAAEAAKESLPEDLRLADLGEHGLRDLSSLEHVYELRGPGLPSGFPPLRSIGAFPTNLPVQVTSFVGRERELEALVELIPDVPLVTLTAVGGAGKTRLALHAAAELLDAFPDGVWFVRFGDLTDPGLVVQTLADTVGTYDRLAEAGMGDRAREVMEERALDMLAERKMLIILDNCEHLIAECARIGDRIVHRCQDVRIVATSREPLGIDGERVFAVPSLAAGDADTLPATPAAQLFVDRARLASPGFAIDDRNADAVAKILNRLDGLPLAIELAASRVRNLSVENLAARLDDAFRVLTGSGRAAIERHRTLEAAITWSYELLGEEERTLFRRLAVFAGGFTLQAAEEVCGFEPLQRDGVLELLGSLVDQSLVVYDQRQDRYRLYFIIGQFAARELARTGESDTVARRHVDFYGPVAMLAGMESFVQGRVSIAEIELDNFRAALSRAIEDGDRRAALRIAFLGWAWIEMGMAREGTEWLARALELPGRERGLDESAEASLALLNSVLWEIPRWRETSGRAEASVRALDASAGADVLGVSVSYRMLGLLQLAAGCGFAGEVERGRELIAEMEASDAGELFEGGRLVVSMQMAMVAGEAEEVLRLAPRARALADAMGHGVARWWVAGFSAVALVFEGRLEESRELLVPVVKETSETSWSGAMLRLLLAAVEAQRGDRARARRLLRSMIAQTRARGMVEVAYNALLAVASLLAQDGEVRIAAELRGAFDAHLARIGYPVTAAQRLFAQSDAVPSGPEREAYEEGYEAGSKLPLTEAVDIAMAALGDDHA